tara:strand:+ start:29123 stop:30493 length:1371 start_codon:yes stop_codon:yes gene_type:complete
MWPLSRAAYPKQFLPLLNQESSLLQSTVKRLEGLGEHQLMCIANEDHRFLVAEQLRQVGALNHNILLEPVGRNTAPAIALAALLAAEENPDAKLLVLPADHDIKDVKQFHGAVEHAIQLANEQRLVTFGIVPSHPETGYGYIKAGKAITNSSYEVAEFVEKPDIETAKAYVASGDFHWNSGMFLFKASRYLEELEKYRPDILNACRMALKDKTEDGCFIRVDSDAFIRCPDESIDYAVMENTDSASVVPMSAGWSDVGSFSSLWDVIEQKDDDGNASIGDVVAIDSKNNYINAEDSLVATVGVDDLVIVQTKDAVLVSTKEKVQEVKQVVNTLKKQERKETNFHREVYRPWGKYDSIDQGERYQVKRITVNPGAKLSVQMHHHRAEHWIVVSGTAKVTNGDKTFLVTENQSTYIPVGVIHALENPGKVPLELIEVQSGSYLGEDDIVRFQDRYGRA